VLDSIDTCMDYPHGKTLKFGTKGETRTLTGCPTGT
jgi:hypothetical protein